MGYDNLFTDPVVLAGATAVFKKAIAFLTVIFYNLTHNCIHAIKKIWL